MIKSVRGWYAVMVVLLAATSMVWAAKAKPKVVVQEALTGAAALEVRYTGQFNELQAQITQALPAVDADRMSAYIKARETEDKAGAELNAANQVFGKIGQAEGAVGHAKNKWIGGADKGIAKA